MSGLLSRRQGATPSDKPGPKSLWVNGVRYAHAAAKFWPSLVDEVAQDFPDCTRFDLSAPSSGKLERNLLFPELALEEGIRELEDASLDDVMKETLAELELMGPPSAVQVRLFRAEDELLAVEIPLDCVDSETFPCLIAWPLEWAGLATDVWNENTMAGTFIGDDRQRGIRYDLAFRLTHTHLSEGLYQRSFSVVHAVSMVA